MIMKIPNGSAGDGGGFKVYFEFVDEIEVSSDNDEVDDDFSEYLWMENLEEFDKLEMQRLEEEDLMKQCIEAMLEDELEADLARMEADRAEELSEVLATLSVSTKNVENSRLNPLAAEFVPSVSLVTPVIN